MKRIKEKTQKHLDYYARDGLRTLCIAKKVGGHLPNTVYSFTLHMSIDLLEKCNGYKSFCFREQARYSLSSCPSI